MKLLGAALVAAAFAVLGASEALRLRRRARLTSEPVSYTHLTLPTICSV